VEKKSPNYKLLKQMLQEPSFLAVLFFKGWKTLKSEGGC